VSFLYLLPASKDDESDRGGSYSNQRGQAGSFSPSCVGRAVDHRDQSRERTAEARISAIL